MRAAAALLVALLFAGCSAPQEAPAAEEDPVEPAQDAAPTPVAAPPPARPSPSPQTGATPTPAPSREPAPEPPAAVPTTMRFAFRADHTLGVVASDAVVPTEERVPETLSGPGFLVGFPQGLPFEPFVSAPFEASYETTEDIAITMRFVASAPAVAAFPSEAGAPTIGVWFGTVERNIAFLTADVPATLQPDEVQTVTLSVARPDGGILFRAGESLVVKAYLSYQTADGSEVSWLVGGDDPAGFTLALAPVALGPTQALVLLDEEAEATPSPAFTANDPRPLEFTFDVPPGARVLVAQLVGTPRAGGTMDMDLTLRNADGDLVGGSFGPYAQEAIALGPGALEASGGGTFTARVASGTSPTGGTLTLVVTAYVPA